MLERELTPSEISRVNKLVRKECCNHDCGNCIMADDGDEHACAQLMSRHMSCRWFEEAVLPLDPELALQLSEEKETPVAYCEICGQEIIKTNNKKKYCDSCAARRKRKQSAKSLRKMRGSM